MSVSDADMAKLMKNPQVQEAMQNAGEEALKDPKVQQVLIDQAKKTLTAENAALVANKAKDWANDPAVQAKARYAAGMAMQGAGAAAQAFMGCIEQGPVWLRGMAFLGGCGSCVLAIWFMLSPANLLHQSVIYFQSLFKVIFALSTMLFECPPTMMEKVPFLSKYQNMLIKWFAFMTTAAGRGGFYIFQGITWLSLVSLSEVFRMFLDVALGFFLVAIGLLHVAMHFGIMPTDIVTKAKNVGKAGYEKLSASGSAPAASSA